MSDFLKMDIFFAVTTAVVVILGLLVALVLVVVFRILRNVEHISRNISEESDIVRRDVADVRMAVKREGFRFKHLLQLATSFFGPVKRARSRKKESDA